MKARTPNAENTHRRHHTYSNPPIPSSTTISWAKLNAPQKQSGIILQMLPGGGLGFLYQSRITVGQGWDGRTRKGPGCRRHQLQGGRSRSHRPPPPGPVPPPLPAAAARRLASQAGCGAGIPAPPSATTHCRNHPKLPENRYAKSLKTERGNANKEVSGNAYQGNLGLTTF